MRFEIVISSSNKEEHKKVRGSWQTICGESPFGEKERISLSIGSLELEIYTRVVLYNMETFEIVS